jgi:hypothetical protein
MPRSESAIGLKQRKYPISEHECMIKFYSPIEHKQRVLKKWLKPPER